MKCKNCGNNIRELSLHWTGKDGKAVCSNCIDIVLKKSERRRDFIMGDSPNITVFSPFLQSRANDTGRLSQTLDDYVQSFEPIFRKKGGLTPNRVRLLRANWKDNHVKPSGNIENRAFSSR